MKYEIWIGKHYSYFDRGVAHTDDGRTLKLKSWVHVATYGADSVLIDDEENCTDGRFPVRWFIKPAGLEFYCVSDDTPSVLFHNESSEPVRIDCYGVLQPGESMDVQPERRNRRGQVD